MAVCRPQGTHGHPQLLPRPGGPSGGAPGTGSDPRAPGEWRGRAVASVVGIDVDQARRDTPGCAHVAHLNNAGAALRPQVVTDAVIGHLQREAEIGGYEAADEAKDALAHTYDALGRLLGCSPTEIALVENATRAFDMAFYSFSFEPGDRILTSHAEYASNAVAMLQVARRSGAVIEVVDDDAFGQLDVADLERRLTRGAGPARLVALTHVPSQGGLVNPAAAIGRLTRAAGIPNLLDACQSVGQLELDVTEVGCDFLAGTGRKFLRGPRGTGFLYASGAITETLEPPFVDLWSATWTGPDTFELADGARRFETWECDVAGRIGLGAAVDYALGVGLADIELRVHELATALRERLVALAGVTVRDRGEHLCGIVTFTVEGTGPAAVRQHLAADAVNVHVTTAASAQLDFPRRGLGEVVRASVHYYNNDEDLDRLIRSLRAL